VDSRRGEPQRGEALPTCGRRISRSRSGVDGCARRRSTRRPPQQERRAIFRPRTWRHREAPRVSDTERLITRGGVRPHLVGGPEGPPYPPPVELRRRSRQRETKSIVRSGSISMPLTASSKSSCNPRRDGLVTTAKGGMVYEADMHTSTRPRPVACREPTARQAVVEALSELRASPSSARIGNRPDRAARWPEGRRDGLGDRMTRPRGRPASIAARGSAGLINLWLIEGHRRRRDTSSPDPSSQMVSSSAQRRTNAAGRTVSSTASRRITCWARDRHRHRRSGAGAARWWMDRATT